MHSLIVTAKMNDVDPQAWLADVLSRIAMYPAHRLDDLLPELDAQAVRHGCRGSPTLAPVNKAFIMPAPRVPVAEMLGEDEDWLCIVANEMDQRTD